MTSRKGRSGTRLRRSPDSHRFYRRLFLNDCHIPECICRITRPIVFWTQNHITLLILTSCRLPQSPPYWARQALAPVVAAPLISRGSVVCILGSCCADGEVSLFRGALHPELVVSIRNRLGRSKLAQRRDPEVARTVRNSEAQVRRSLSFST
jgi:hypothetical protein